MRTYKKILQIVLEMQSVESEKTRLCTGPVGKKNAYTHEGEYLQLEIDPGLGGLSEVDGAVVDNDGEVVLARVHDISHEGQSNLARRVLHLDGVIENQGGFGLDGGGVLVGSQLYDID